MPIPPAELVETIRRESDALIASLRRLPELDAPVPSCPDWTARHLAHHIGEVHEFFTDQVRAADTDGPHKTPAPPVEEVDVDWADQKASALVDALGAADPDDPCWNWSGNNLRVRWVMRRMAQETSVHRWDAESIGGGEPSPLELELAIDGIDELLDMFLPALQAEAAEQGVALDIGGSLHLHTTDSAHGEWILRSVDGEVLVGHGHEKGDAAIRGTASDLLLFLWGRVPLDQLEVFGDTSVIDRLKALPLFD